MYFYSYLSRAIVSSGNISHNEKLGVFTVLGTTGNPNVIRLFPKESCSCPSTGRCYHIMAVRMSVGLDTTCCKRKINLSQLRRNTRSRRDKTSGRKRPRIEDSEVIAAPDSLSSFPSKSDQSGVSQLEKSKSFSPPVQPKSPTPPLRPKSPTPPIRPKSPTPPIEPKSSTPPIRPKSPTPPKRPKSPTPPIQPKSPNSSMRPKSPKLESLNQPIFKTTRRKRKKIAYNNQPGNTEILANFDHLYAAIR